MVGGKYKAQQVTDILRQRIALGQYAVGDRLPSIEQLNDEFFSVDAGPKPARDAYAPLIQEGMVTARVGRAGGHFLVSAEPLPTLQFLQEVATSLTDIVGVAMQLANRAVYVVEFRKARSRHGFGECFLPSRLAAESFAVAVLQALGEPRLKAERAAAAASESPALTQRGGYHVRIYGRRLGQLRDDTPGSTSATQIN
ncbi:GntR family transcriptional regulator [Mycobacterium hackensackense]|uniref:GntR family transcriptional regulator n=1 Tax=Mycobacterium hackensackense TaxID=228909 RepID=UPI002265F49F|nr:GntR family transcriptional regulator [Mycobacterium hackensackense]MCV7256790.1 GntR family transcriptional regulator [Mycobacterium hackensackense]